MNGVNEPKVQYNICRSKYVNGKFTKPELLNRRINSKYQDYTPFVAPDESYLIFSSVNRPDGYGSGDLYISFKDSNNEWSMPINMGKDINTKYNERFPSVSADGKYLFFISNIKKKENVGNLSVPQNRYCDVYWVSTEKIDNLKKMMMDGLK